MKGTQGSFGHIPVLGWSDSLSPGLTLLTDTPWATQECSSSPLHLLWSRLQLSCQLLDKHYMLRAPPWECEKNCGFGPFFSTPPTWSNFSQCYLPALGRALWFGSTPLCMPVVWQSRQHQLGTSAECAGPGTVCCLTCKEEMWCLWNGEWGCHELRISPLANLLYKWSMAIPKIPLPYVWTCHRSCESSHRCVRVSTA